MGFERWRRRTLGSFVSRPQPPPCGCAARGSRPDANIALGRSHRRSAAWERARAKLCGGIARIATARPPHALSRVSPRPTTRLALALGDVSHSATSGAMQSCSYAERTEACKS